MKTRSVLIFIFLTTLSSVFGADYERFEENGKFGLKDKSGTIIIPASFDALGWSDGNFSVIGQITGYRKDNQWGLLNLKKEFITKADYTTLTWPGGDRIIVSKAINPYTIKFGALDLQGKLVIPFYYDAIKLYGLRAVVMIKNGTKYEHGLIDLNDNSIVPVRFKKITPIGTLRYAVENFSDKTALCNEQGKWVTEFVIDAISDFHHDLAIMRQGWKQGIIDRNGDIKVQATYRNIIILAPDKLSVRKADEWKLLDENLKELKSIAADELAFGPNELYRIAINGKEGIVDQNLQPQWPMDYDRIEILPNRQYIVKRNGKYGVARNNQTSVLPNVFDSVDVQSNFVRVMQKSAGRSTWEVYDTFGIKKTTKPYDFVAAFNGKFFPVKNRGYWGAVDRYGKEKIACVYDSLYQQKDSLIAVGFRGQYGIINTEDRWKVNPQSNAPRLVGNNLYLEERDSVTFLKNINGSTVYFSDQQIAVFDDHLVETMSDGAQKEINFQGQITMRRPAVAPFAQQTYRESEGYIGIKRDGKFGFVDNRGRLRIANRYDGIGEFHNGLAPIRLLGKWGYVNQADEIVIQPTYESADNFDNKVATVSRKGKKGLINVEGREILELRYDSIRRISDNLFSIMLNTSKGLVSTNGTVLIEPRFESLQVIENKVIVFQNKQYGILTTDGLSLLPIRYSSIVYMPIRKKYLVEEKALWQTLELKN